MSVKPILIDGDPMLRTKCREVRKFGAALDQLIEDLFDTLYDVGGRGLSAPQIGIPARVFVMDATWKDGKKDPVAIVNPEIINTNLPMVVGHEQCLSIPGKTFAVGRPLNIEMSWVTPGETRTSNVFWSTEARICAHEFDHLEGVLVSDVGAEQ